MIGTGVPLLKVNEGASADAIGIELLPWACAGCWRTATRSNRRPAISGRARGPIVSLSPWWLAPIEEMTDARVEELLGPADEFGDSKLVGVGEHDESDPGLWDSYEGGQVPVNRAAVTLDSHAVVAADRDSPSVMRESRVGQSRSAREHKRCESRRREAVRTAKGRGRSTATSRESPSVRT